jgi:chromosome segregation ATPase
MKYLLTKNQSAVYGTLAPLSGKFGLEKKYLLTESEINSYNQFCNEHLEAIAVKEKELACIAKELSIREEHLTKLTFEKLDELSKRERKIEEKEKDSDFLHNRTVNRAIELDKREQKLTDKEEALQKYELERQEFYRERFPYVNKLMEDKKKAIEEVKSYKNLYEEQTNKTSELLILNKKLLSEADETKKLLRKKEQEEKEDKSKISVLNDTISKLKEKIDSFTSKETEYTANIKEKDNKINILTDILQYFGNKLKYTDSDIDKIYNKRKEGYRMSYICGNEKNHTR